MKFFKKKNRSLRTRLSVIFGLLVFAICVATTALATFGAGNSLNKQIDELQEQRVMNITSEISTQVMKMQQSLEQIGRNPLFGQKNATKTTYEQIGSMMTKEEENTSFDAIKFVTAEGLVLTDGSPSIKDKDYFKKAMNGEFSISGIVEVGGSEVIYFIAPVKDKDDKVTGAIAGIFSREELNSVFADVKYNFLVMNKAGELITTNMKSLATEYKNPVTDKDADASIKELHSTMTSGKTGNTKLTINSSEKNISYTQVKNTEWYVATILEQTEVNKPIKNLMYAMIAISAILMVLGSIVTYVFAGFITKSIISLTSHIGEFAGGDFRNPITDKIMILEDEVGVAAHGLEQMRDSLQNMIVGIKQEMQQLSDSSEVLNSNAEQMLGNSSNISEATSQMAAGVENQSVDLVEISQRIDVFGSMIEEIIKSIQDIYEKIQEMSQSAEAGNMIGNTLKDSVTQTGEIFKEVSDSVTDLNEYVSQVSSITVLINEIAGQTNLLALNASIEAARAGEAGKGFAVVADEIRQLADQVKDSSSKIDHLISQIDDKATVMSNNTEQLQSELTKQMEQIQDSIKQYTKIGDEVTHISADILDMNTSAKYIGENKDIIVESVSSVTAVAEEITASTQEVKSSIDVNQQVSNSVRDLAIELSDKTQQVVERLEQFKVEE